jgi:hypothetical protein
MATNVTTAKQVIHKRVVTTTTDQNVFTGPIPDASWLQSTAVPNGPQSPPAVTKHLEPIVATAGNDATFEANFIGNPTPKVAWIKDGKPVTASDKFALTYDAGGTTKLTVRSVQDADLGNYFVLGENQFGRLQSGANLLFPSMHQIINIQTLNASGAMNFSPCMIQGPDLVQVRSNSMAILEVHLTGTPAVSWLKDGKQLVNGPKHQISADPANGIYRLVIQGCGLPDSGKYTCLARNPNGQQEYSMNIAVMDGPSAGGGAGPPVFIETFHTAIMEPGFPLTLHCKVDPSCAGPITFAWSKDGKNLPPGQPFQIVNKDFETTLIIPNVKPADTGLFKCTATGPGGAASHPGRVDLRTTQPRPLPGTRAKETPDVAPTQRNLPMGVGEIPDDPREMELIRLRHVQEKEAQEAPERVVDYPAPQFLSSPQDATVVEDQKVVFACQYTPTDDPKLTIVWMKDGKEINASSRMVMEYDFGKASLVIKDAYPQDTGRFTCVAKNLKGQSDVGCNLTVIEDRGVVSSSLFGGHQAGSQSVAQLEQRLADPKKKDDKVGRPNWAVERNN